MRTQSSIVSVSRIGVLVCFVATTVADERLTLPNAGELVVDTSKTRTLLLTTELAVSRELIELSVERFNRVENDQESLRENGAILLADRLRDAYRLMNQIDPKINVPVELDQELLSLKIIASAQAVESAKGRLRDREMASASVQMHLQRHLLAAMMAVVPLQLKLAEVSGIPSEKREKLIRDWIEFERRGKVISDRFDQIVSNMDVASINALHEEIRGAVSEGTILLDSAWELCKKHVPAKSDVSGVQTHLDAIRSHATKALALADSILAPSQPQNVGNSKLRPLQVKKLAFLRERYQSAEHESSVGRDVKLSELSHILEKCLDAEMELCSTAGERIARCQQNHRKLEHLAKHAEADYRAGIRPRQELEDLKIRLLDMEILLLREQKE